MVTNTTPADFVRDIRQVMLTHNVKALHVHETGAMFRIQPDGSMIIGCKMTIEGFDKLPSGKPNLKSF